MEDDVKSEPNVFPGIATASVMVGIMAFVVLCVGALWLIYPSARDVHTPPPDTFPPPRLEVMPTQDYDNYLARQKALLAGGSGRVAIRDAMQAVVRSGTLEPGIAQ